MLPSWLRLKARLGARKSRKGGDARSPARSRPEAERLEDRCLLNAASFVGPFRSLDGTANNLAHPDWGSAGEQLLRLAPAAYGDGISTPAGANRPNPRVISNRIVAHGAEELINNRQLSNYSYVWGQFLDHDLDLTVGPLPGEPVERLDVIVPAGDQFFPPGSVLPFTRSRVAPGTGTSNPRQQINEITAWVDASNVYGSDEARARALRTGVGGKLRVTALGPGRRDDLLPYNTLGLENENRTGLPADQLFVAGDVRSNENVELTALHTLFVREHNRLADRIARENPRLGDEEVYQRARAIVGAQMQVITYKEWLPSLVGPNALRPYRGYNPNVNAGIANEFSTASFRLHSLINDDVEFFDNNGRSVLELELREAFGNPGVIGEEGIDTLLKYVASASAEELDNQLVNGLRNFLSGSPGGLDLAVLNIQRGRDHGLADYNRVREAYGLPRVRDFADITSNREVQEALRELYGTVDNIDLWVGGLAEDHVPGSSFGPTIREVLIDQFERLRDGDRFWYQRIFSGSLLAELENTTLSDIIKRNTGITNLQDNVFFMRAEARGTVFFDRNGDGNRDQGEFGIPGVLVQLLNEEGLIAETRTNLAGRYSFDEFDETGDFEVHVVVPSFVRVTTENPQEFLVSRGDVAINGLDFGLRLAFANGESDGEAFADIVTALASGSGS